MKVDAPGLVAAAQGLVTAVAGLGGSEVPHPPLAADPASIGAAGRLTTAGAELTAALSAHVSALVASVEHLTGAAVTYTATDEHNAAAIAALNTGMVGGATVTGSATPAPPIPPDARAPMPPPVGLLPEAISAAVHSGTPGGGEAFTSAWFQVAGAARGAAATIRSTIAHLPETLNGPASTPAVSRHLLSFADGLDTYAARALNLVNQANTHAANQSQALEDIPSPQQFTAAQNRIQTIAYANATSGGKWAAPLASAIADRNRLDEQAVSGYGGYHERTDTATAGDDAGTGGQGQPGDRAGADPSTADGAGALDPNVEAMSPESAGEMASMLPQLMPAVLGAVGGLAGGVMGAVTKMPASVIQAGTQALGGAIQGLSGLAPPQADSPHAGSGGPSPDSGDPTGAAGGDEAPTTPAAGAGAPELGVAPSTGAPPTPAFAPVGATEGPGLRPASGGATGTAPMGMPMGMPMGGAPGGGGPAGKDEAGRQSKVVGRDIPHTEDVTGRVDTNRLAAAAASHRDRDPEAPNDDNPPGPAAPIVRRLVTRTPKEPT